ncbi:MAG: antitoxin VapB family protein [Nanoarchaeota archaeon]|jgi:predicted CopG family antitoxin|nr:antitoxin VapB family protein [Nanoarchaeota archaeon]
MGSMNISIKQEAYDLLCSLKGKGKSFSDIIIEVVNEKEKRNRDIMKFAGVLKERGETYWKDRENEYKDVRESLDSELESRGNRR